MFEKNEFEVKTEGRGINAAGGCAYAEAGGIIFLLTPKSSVAFIYSSCTLRQGLEKMRRYGYTAIPVINEDGSYAGTVSEGDFLWHILDSGKTTLREQEEYPLMSIMREGWNPAVGIRATADELLTRVAEQNFVPVVDDRGKFMGIITRKSVIRHFRCREEKPAARSSYGS